MTLNAYKLGDVANVDWGNTSITKSSYTGEGYPAFSAAGQDGFMPIYEHEGDAVVVSAIGARCGKCFWASGKWIAIKNTIIVKSKDEDVCNTAYLYFLLNDEKFWPRSGSGQPFIAIGKAKLLDIHLPDIHTQKRIVHVLWSIQVAKETLEAELSLERERKAALVAYLFTHGTRGESLKQTEIGEMPKSWDVIRLKDIIIKAKQRDPQKNPNEIFTYIDVSSISNERFVIAETTELKGSDAPSRARKIVREGDIIFATVRPTLKRVAIVPEQYNEQVCSTGYCVIRPQKEALKSHYIFAYLLSDFVLSYVAGKQKGATYPAINDGDLYDLLVPLPKSEEQDHIGEIYEAMHRKCEVLHQEITILGELFHSMLDKLMSGELSVEPLLEDKKIVKKKVAA